jgi:diamine N-acetyltransferase
MKPSEAVVDKTRKPDCGSAGHTPAVVVPPFSQGGEAGESFFLGPLLPDEVDGICRRLAAMDPWRTLGYSAEGLVRYLRRDDPSLSCYVAKFGTQTVAVVCVRRPWLMGPFIELLAIFDPFRGKGLGREILGWVEAHVAPGSQNVWVTVSSFNTGARGFYQRMGFEEVAELQDLVRAGSDELLLRKRLNR